MLYFPTARLAWWEISVEQKANNFPTHLAHGSSTVGEVRGVSRQTSDQLARMTSATVGSQRQRSTENQYSDRKTQKTSSTAVQPDRMFSLERPVMEQFVVGAFRQAEVAILHLAYGGQHIPDYYLLDPKPDSTRTLFPFGKSMCIHAS